MTSLTPRREAYKKEIVLLSRGFSNRQAWPDGRITVYPWDYTIDDFLIDSRLKGNRLSMLWGALRLVCGLTDETLDDFVTSEITTVLLVSRALAKGGRIRYKSHCPACGHTEDESVNVPDDLVRVGEKAQDYPGYDNITLPVCKDVIALRPLTIKDEKSIVARSNEARAEISDRVLHTLKAIITVNGERPDSVPEMLAYHNALAPDDVGYLEKQHGMLSPHLDLVLKHLCSQCGKTFDHPLSIDQDFS